VHTSFLIVGAGPFGLAMAAQAKARAIDHVLVGHPMSFWKRHMPAGMFLRSGCNWHLDPAERDTIERFLRTRGQVASDVEPLSLNLYLEYAHWFEREKGIEALSQQVVRLDERHGRFAATLEDGSIVTADRVLLALGFAAFAHIPGDAAALVPAELSSHTCDLVAPEKYRGRRVLIVGGRQSAFESAALIAEAGAATVHVCHRHATPAFTASDWAWVDALLERIGNDPAWYRGLSETERRALDLRFWTEGRLKLEPWLGPRVRRDSIAIHPGTSIVGCQRIHGALRVSLNAGETLEVDHVLFATGYQVNLQRLSLLREGNLFDRVECRDGFPNLDTSLQTTVPGLFITSLPATRDFGLFFAFTAAVRASARIVARAITGRSRAA
jgi:thioredoxin reductase